MSFTLFTVHYWLGVESTFSNQVFVQMLGDISSQKHARDQNMNMLPCVMLSKVDVNTSSPDVTNYSYPLNLIELGA